MNQIGRPGFAVVDIGCFEHRPGDVEGDQRIQNHLSGLSARWKQHSLSHCGQNRFPYHRSYDEIWVRSSQPRDRGTSILGYGIRETWFPGMISMQELSQFQFQVVADIWKDLISLNGFGGLPSPNLNRQLHENIARSRR